MQQHLDIQLTEVFDLLVRFFNKNKIPYCLIGGLVASYWGEPRYTKDSDFIIHFSANDWSKLAEILPAPLTLEERGPSQAQIFKKQGHLLLADVILSEMDYQEEAITRAITIDLLGTKVNICSAEDLIILKTIAFRTRDIDDIERVLAQRKNLDKIYLKKWLITWEMLERFNKQFPEFKL